MKLFKHLPNFITLLNLLTGSVGIVMALQGNLIVAAFCVFIAAVFDFLDGFVARLLKANSSIGKELDSLADVISFGLLPGIIAYSLLSQNTESVLWPWLGLVIAAFSALRLAKFNVDTRQSDQFIGLPTPANAILFASLPLILESGNWIFLSNPGVLSLLVVVFSLLLVAEMPLMALKFKNFSWKENKLKYIFLLISLVLLFVLAWMAIPLIIVLYIFFSLAGNYL
ncbi:MAG: CDP-diacylglycerol--serine O-phosphatidyltransferase [Cyclobacteriaceae bacterium]